MADKLDFDPFELLELNNDCSKKDVIAAFRKLALKWHPDKNLDKQDLANQMFLKVQKAFEILTDPAAKAALVHLKKAKEAQKQRVKKLDAKRQKLRDDLEAREKRANQQKMDEMTCAQKFDAEIERLRKEGSKLLKEEKERLEREIASQSKLQPPKNTSLKVSNKITFPPGLEEQTNNLAALDDLENAVFMRMKQAQEKKRNEQIPAAASSL